MLDALDAVGLCQLVRLAQPGEDLAGHVFGLSVGEPHVAIQLAEQDHEFVPAEARHRVAFAHAGDEPPRHFDEQPVADFVAVGVVERLEVVEIEEHQGAMTAVAPQGRQQAAEAIPQQAPVGQLGKRIEEGELLDFLLQPPPLGNVVRQRHHLARLARPLGQPGVEPLAGDGPAVARQVVVDVLRQDVLMQHALQIRQQAFAFVRRQQEFGERPADHLLALPAENDLGLAVPVGDDETLAPDDARRGRGLENDAMALLAARLFDDGDCQPAIDAVNVQGDGADNQQDAQNGRQCPIEPGEVGLVLRLIEEIVERLIRRHQSKARVGAGDMPPAPRIAVADIDHLGIDEPPQFARFVSEVLARLALRVVALQDQVDDLARVVKGVAPATQGGGAKCGHARRLVGGQRAPGE